MIPAEFPMNEIELEKVADVFFPDRRLVDVLTIVATLKQKQKIETMVSILLACRYVILVLNNMKFWIVKFFKTFGSINSRVGRPMVLSLLNAKLTSN